MGHPPRGMGEGAVGAIHRIALVLGFSVLLPESFWATLKTECFHDQIPLNLKAGPSHPL
jgi:hypothetical protein